jgi:hypothetical protein
MAGMIEVTLLMLVYLCISFVLIAPFVWIASWAFIRDEDEAHDIKETE